MSSIASATLLPIDALARLQAATKPEKRLFFGSRDRFHTVLRQQGRHLSDYRGQGFVLGTLLVYLKSRGIDLLESTYDGVANQLSRDRGSTFIILTSEQRSTNLAQLQESGFQLAELEVYYQQFNKDAAPGVGAAMLEGIRFLSGTLAAVTPGSIALLEIG
jgi:hypothetical protein